MKNPLTQFVVSFFLVLIVTLVVVWGLSGPFEKYIDVTNFENIGAIIQGTLGIAVGLAGAFVAIKVASLANSIIQHERERDDFSFLNEKIEAGLNPIINVARQMSLLYAAQISAEQESSIAINKITSDDNWSYSDLSMKIGFELRYKRSISSSLNELANSLEAVLLNSYAMFLWHQTGCNERFHLDKIQIGDSKKTLNVADDLGEIIGILRMRALSLEDQSINADKSDVLVPRMAANAAKTHSGDDFNNKAVRSLLEIGAEILCYQQADSVSNIGAAILLDISKCIPNSPEELKETVGKLFSVVIEKEFLETSPILSVTQKLGTRFWFGSSLGYALTEFEKIGVRLSR